MSGSDLLGSESTQQVTSPENLDQVMVVTSARRWILLATAAFLLASAIAYGFLGRIPNLVSGQGMLLHGGDIVSIQNNVQGIVTEIHVRAGESVEKDQLVLTVHRPDLEDHVAEIQLQLDLANMENTTLLAVENQQLERQEKAHASQAASYQEMVTLTARNLENDETKLAHERELFEKKLVSEDDIFASESKVSATRGALIGQKQKIADLDRNLFDLKNQIASKQAEREVNIKKLELSLEQAHSHLDHGSRVHTPFSGRLLEVDVLPGQQVSPASTLFKLERSPMEGSPLIGSFFVSADHATNLVPGLRTQVFPAGVDSDIHGYLIAEVVRVSDFPVSKQRVLNAVGDETVAAEVTHGLGVPYLVDLRFLQDRSTTSGYRWSSRKGPPVLMQPGTLCKAKYEVDSRRPISLLLSWVRDLLGAPNDG